MECGFTFDLGIFDEAHKTVGSRKKQFSQLLFENNVRIRKRLFMTATERLYSGRSDEIISMDDERLYGPTFHMLSFKAAIERRPPIISDYKVLTIRISENDGKLLPLRFDLLPYPLRLPGQGATPQQTNEINGLREGQGATKRNNVAGRNGSKPTEIKECCGVAVWETPISLRQPSSYFPHSPSNAFRPT